MENSRTGLDRVFLVTQSGDKGASRPVFLRLVGVQSGAHSEFPNSFGRGFLGSCQEPRKMRHLADAASLVSDLGYPYYLTRTGYRHLPPFGSHPGPSLFAPVQRPRASLAQRIGSCGFYPGFLIIPSGRALPCDCSRAHRTEAVRPQGEKFACV